jgi:NAD(P)-dependent dehydrogenase (short-subunit alcohol dehydrogenase family)
MRRGRKDPAGRGSTPRWPTSPPRPAVGGRGGCPGGLRGGRHPGDEHRRPPVRAHEAHDLATWRAAYEGLLESVVELTGLVLPGMKAQGWGRIVNVTSISVKQPVEGLILSNTLRAGVTGFARTVANEVAAHGVTVNNVLPGYTRTERLGSSPPPAPPGAGSPRRRSSPPGRPRPPPAAWASPTSSRRSPPSSAPSGRVHYRPVDCRGRRVGEVAGLRFQPRPPSPGKTGRGRCASHQSRGVTST